MFNAKKFVFAAVLLSATSAFASNFRGADQVYIPVAGKTVGASGTFISDVFISNLTDEAVEVSVLYTPIGGSAPVQEFRDVIQLNPRERKEFIDFMPSVLNLPSGFGQLVFNGCLANADCGAGTQDLNGFSPNFRDIAVSSRIYSIPAGTTLAQNPPTTGQFLAGIPWYNFVSKLAEPEGLGEVFVHGLRATGGTGTAGTYRSNVGLTNASQWSSTELVVRLFNGGGQQIGTEFVQTLAPLGNVLLGITQMFPAAVGQTNLYMTVSQRSFTKAANAPASCPDGCPSFLAYGSVVDNVSGDATTLETVYHEPLSGAAIEAIYGSGAGKPGYRRSASH